jgi:hypothetical protein
VDEVGWPFWEVVAEVVGLREERSVSCRPGAEGAPRAVDCEGADLSWEVVLFVLVAWAVAGTMRRDCEWEC